MNIYLYTSQSKYFIDKDVSPIVDGTETILGSIIASIKTEDPII